MQRCIANLNDEGSSRWRRTGVAAAGTADGDAIPAGVPDALCGCFDA
jgi:hypothetical protein